MTNDPAEQGPPQYYRPGPSSGYYPQYPQNPYPHGWTPATPPAPYPQQPAAAGGPPPAAPPRPAPVARPRQVTTGLVLLLAATVPFLVMGVTTMFVTVNDAVLNDAGIPREQLDRAMAQAGVGMEQLTQLMRVMGGVFLALALVYAVLAVVAFLGRSGARLTVAILTVVYGVPLLLMMMASMSLFAVLVVGVAAAGVVLLYSRPATEWYDARRAGAAPHAS